MTISQIRVLDYAMRSRCGTEIFLLGFFNLLIKFKSL